MEMSNEATCILLGLPLDESVIDVEDVKRRIAEVRHQIADAKAKRDHHSTSDIEKTGHNTALNHMYGRLRTLQSMWHLHGGGPAPTGE